MANGGWRMSAAVFQYDFIKKHLRVFVAKKKLK